MPSVEAELHRRRASDGALVPWLVNDDGTEPVADAVVRTLLQQLIDVSLQRVALTFMQGTPAAVWEIDHELGHTPNLTVEDSNGNIVEPDITYSPGHVSLDFGGVSMSGRAHLV